uniref:PWI domain-containing protein n=1 Tax=Panagrolaimus superbus TaxID=310955 RepID=A0A914YLI3_9BILA
MMFERREKERERDRSRRRKHHSKERSRSPRRHRSRSRSPRRSSRRDRDRSPKSERSSKKSRKQKHSDTEEDEAKKRERQKRKEREEMYQRRLKKWEDKEVRFAREVEKDREKERQRRKGAEKEAKKLQLFHENYDDDVNDQKYYRGDLLIQRRRMLEQQLELDRKDREIEEAEFEKMKSEIMASNPENFTNVEEEARKRKENEETKMNIKLGIKSSPVVPLSITPDEDDDSRPAQFKVEPQNSGWESVDSPSVSLKVPSLAKKINVQTARVTTNGLFADDVDDEEEAKKKRKLQPFIISSEERIAVLTPDERKRMIRDLIDKIPKSREQIFAYPMKWEYLDDAMIETRIRPWIAKKIQIALGEQEPDLTTFICECVKKRSDPKKLVLDLSMVFDEEAESFITKMWRLIIYETEARYKGLSALPSAIPST